MLKSHDW